MGIILVQQNHINHAHAHMFPQAFQTMVYNIDPLTNGNYMRVLHTRLSFVFPKNRLPLSYHLLLLLFPISFLTHIYNWISLFKIRWESIEKYKSYGHHTYKLPSSKLKWNR